MIEPGGSRRRRRTTCALPSVQTDMMMVAAGRKERCLASIPLRQLKSEHVAIKRERALQVRHFQVDVTDPGLRGNRLKTSIRFHALNMPQAESF